VAEPGSHHQACPSPCCALLRGLLPCNGRRVHLCLPASAVHCALQYVLLCFLFRISLVSQDKKRFQEMLKNVAKLQRQKGQKVIVLKSCIPNLLSSCYALQYCTLL